MQIKAWEKHVMCKPDMGNKIFGSLSKHDDDGDENPTNLHIWRSKTVFLHALHVDI